MSPRRDVGSHSKFTANKKISIIPTQKPGIDWPSTAIVLATMSHTEPRFTAEMTPNGIANIEKRTPPRAS
jgi:hypothetical protein